MFKFSGGDVVKKGHYWNFSTGERIRFEGESILPGGSKDIYLRARSGFLLLVVAPVLGLAYAFFLPAATIAIFAIVAIRKISVILRPSLEAITQESKEKT